MRAILLVTVATLAFTSAASAKCTSFIDTKATHYIENSTALTLCLQDELSSRVERQDQLNQLQADMALKLKMLQLDLEARQAAAATMPLPTFTTP